MAVNDSQIDGYADGEKPLGFHHKTGEYRENQPQWVKDIASEEYTKKRGFFRVLVSGKGNKSIFFVLCITMAIVLLVTVFGKNPNEASVGGVSCSLKAFAFQDKVYVTLELTDPHEGGKKAVQKPQGAAKQADLKFSLYNTDNADAASSETTCSFDGTKKNVYQTFDDYDIVKVKCSVTCGGKHADLTAKVTKQ